MQKLVTKLYQMEILDYNKKANEVFLMLEEFMYSHNINITRSIVDKIVAYDSVKK